MLTNFHAIRIQRFFEPNAQIHLIIERVFFCPPDNKSTNYERPTTNYSTNYREAYFPSPLKKIDVIGLIMTIEIQSTNYEVNLRTANKELRTLF